MFDEQRKTAKIVAELTMFFLSVGADQINSSIKRQGGQGIIAFHANYSPEEMAARKRDVFGSQQVHTIHH